MRARRPAAAAPRRSRLFTTLFRELTRLKRQNSKPQKYSPDTISFSAGSGRGAGGERDEARGADQRDAPGSAQPSFFFCAALVLCVTVVTTVYSSPSPTTLLGMFCLTETVSWWALTRVLISCEV